MSDECFDIDFCPTAKGSIDQLFIKATSDDFADFALWVKKLHSVEPLTQAFLLNEEYDHWQNAQDPLEYTAVGRPYEHLPMISNGLPPPLDQMVIDTSKNPGRWEFRNGYLEAVSNPMWLGTRFWQISGRSKQAVEGSALWETVEEISGGITQFQAQARPFDSATRPQSELQLSVRKLVYC